MCTWSVYFSESSLMSRLDCGAPNIHSAIQEIANENKKTDWYVCVQCTAHLEGVP